MRTKKIYKMENIGMDEVVFMRVKQPKYFPIETAPINEKVLVWDSKNKEWESVRFGDDITLKCAIVFTNLTHWQPMPEGPK